MMYKKTTAKSKVGSTGAKGVDQYGGVAANENPNEKKGLKKGNSSVLNDWGGAPNNENPYAIK